VLNVVNFGGGSYVLYAEIDEDDGSVDRRPRALQRQLRASGAAAPGRGQGARRRDRPDRRAPAAGIADLAREKIVAALGEDPMEQGLQVAHGGSDDSASRA
jgi:hypothetical protein